MSTLDERMLVPSVLTALRESAWLKVRTYADQVDKLNEAKYNLAEAERKIANTKCELYEIASCVGAEFVDEIVATMKAADQDSKDRGF